MDFVFTVFAAFVSLGFAIGLFLLLSGILVRLGNIRELLRRLALAQGAVKPDERLGKVPAPVAVIVGALACVGVAALLYVPVSISAGAYERAVRNIGAESPQVTPFPTSSATGSQKPVARAFRPAEKSGVHTVSLSTTEFRCSGRAQIDDEEWVNLTAGRSFEVKKAVSLETDKPSCWYAVVDGEPRQLTWQPSGRENMQAVRIAFP